METVPQIGTNLAAWLNGQIDLSSCAAAVIACDASSPLPANGISGRGGRRAGHQLKSNRIVKIGQCQGDRVFLRGYIGGTDNIGASLRVVKIDVPVERGIGQNNRDGLTRDDVLQRPIGRFAARVSIPANHRRFIAEHAPNNLL